MEESNATVSPAVEACSLAAFESLKEEISGVPDDDLVHINVDIPTAVTTVLRALAALRSLRPKMVNLPDFDVVQFDKLETYARASFYANMLYNIATRPPESMPALTAEATRLRDLLHSDALALAHRKLLNEDDLRVVKAATGYRPLASDLIALAAVLRANWDKVKTKTAVDTSDLDRADRLSDRILNAVSQKEQPSSSALANAALDRQRAYSLFFRAYDHARRAVRFLRWKEGDVGTIAPSLFSGRNAGPKRRTDEPVVPPQGPAIPTSLGSMPAETAPAPNSTSDGRHVH